MHKAALYKRANEMQREDAELIMRENPLQWCPDGHDTILDIGCGSGDVLMDFVYPLLPQNFRLLVGTDISSKMIELARSDYSRDKRVKFGILDIASEDIPLELCGRFDHITSFYCFHWIQNQKLAFQNIFKLLRPSGGDCLITFLASSSLFEIYAAFRQTPKWAPYMKDTEKYISPTQYAADPVGDINKMLYQNGFTDCKVEIRQRMHVFSNATALRSCVEAVCPFLERMSSNQQTEFLDDILKAADAMNFRQETPDANGNYNYFTPYKLMVIYARKKTPTINEPLIKG